MASSSAIPSRQTSTSTGDLELCTIRSNASHEQLFPTFYRRGGTGGDGVRSPAPVSASAVISDKAPEHGELLERVIYEPMPERKKLGYFSTAALIISKVIGTGIFVKPSVVVLNSGGKGVSLGLWLGAGLMSLAGLIIYVELGIALPFSGGEIVYVDEAYPRPKYLALIVISLLFVFLTHWAGNCITFAKLVLQAFDPENANPNYHLQKFVALVMVTCVCAVHIFSRKMGIALNNFLAVYKVSLVAFIILVGFAAMGGARGKGADTDGQPYGLVNISIAEVTRTEQKSMLEYVSAILGVLWAYTGWENANYVLSEVKRPPGKESRVFKVAAFASIGTLTLLYLLANIAYFTVLTNEDLVREGDIVAAKFFEKVFGRGWFSQRAIKIMVALSILGNFTSSTYSVARVKQEIAKLRILPFSKFWARHSHYDTPVGAIILHWLVAAIFIVVTPNNKNDEVYNLVTDLFIYGQSWMFILVSLGVLALHSQPFRAWKPQLFRYSILVTIIAIYVPLNFFVIVLSWWPPPSGHRDIPSYVTPGVATGIIGFGIAYWAGFAKVLPALGYQVDSAPDELVDGSRIVTFRRYKTGFAKRVEEWWESKFARGREEELK